MTSSEASSFFLPGNDGKSQRIGNWCEEVAASSTQLDNSIGFSPITSDVRARSCVAPNVSGEKDALSRAGRGAHGLSIPHLPLPRGELARSNRGVGSQFSHATARDHARSSSGVCRSATAGEFRVDDRGAPSVVGAGTSTHTKRSGQISNADVNSGAGETLVRSRTSRFHRSVDPRDSASQMGGSRIPSEPDLAAESASTRSTVSLSDSSVDRVARQMVRYSLNDAGHHRKEAARVSEDAATSARRPKHRSRNMSRADRVAAAGQLIFGSGTTVARRRGEYVMIKRKHPLVAIEE